MTHTNTSINKGGGVGEVCNKSVSWRDGEYEGECELPEGHAGPHYDGMSCFNDENNEVELKTLPPRPIHYSIGYYKAGKPYYVHNEVLDNQNRIISFSPEPAVKIRIEVKQ